mmetsp:Transcript_13093/g.33274  ORF Transcript_13093/g.33274 Transcript_13093/m.33274 type:complete len:223 (+) Transcript_13093:215-883(+)
MVLSCAGGGAHLPLARRQSDRRRVREREARLPRPEPRTRPRRGERALSAQTSASTASTHTANSEGWVGSQARGACSCAPIGCSPVGPEPSIGAAGPNQPPSPCCTPSGCEGAGCRARSRAVRRATTDATPGGRGCGSSGGGPAPSAPARTLTACCHPRPCCPPPAACCPLPAARCMPPATCFALCAAWPGLLLPAPPTGACHDGHGSRLPSESLGGGYPATT